MSVDSGALLSWCQRNTSGYQDVEVDSFGDCWRDGLAFCALIHKFHPEKIDFPSLSPSNQLENLQLAFKIGQQLGISQRMDAQSFLSSPSLDSDSIIAYLSHYYNTFHITQLMNYTRAPLLNDSLSSSSLLDRVHSGSPGLSGSPSLSPAPSLSSSPSLSSPSLLSSLSISDTPLSERTLSVSFIPTSPNEDYLQRSPSPFKMKKYPETSESDGKKKEKEKEEKPKAKAKDKEKEKTTKAKPKEKEKETKAKPKTTPTKTPTKSSPNSKTEKEKKEKTKTDKADKAAKLQRPPSNMKMRKSPSTTIAKESSNSNLNTTKTPRSARSVSAPPARPPSATPGKTPRKENKTPRTPATPTPRNPSPRKGTPKVEKEKKSKKDRPITPSVKADSVMSDAASDRIRTLEIENSLLKAKLNEYKSMCESLELRLNNEMELRKKVVQQLQGFRVPED